MLILNISVEHGLCNGTRMRVEAWGEHNILLSHINGIRAARKEQYLVHRCVFRMTEGEGEQQLGTVKWVREQFPIRPGFVLTINKAQGQTMEKVGIVLNKSRAFSHGQLYVAASRVKRRAALKFLLPSGMSTVDNVVQQRLIDQEEIDLAKSGWKAEKDNCNYFYISLIFLLFLQFQFFYSRPDNEPKTYNSSIATQNSD